ncbi:bifunctional metallophosphatase/5'-nucleotidase [Candidatus Riflebacteria bacterium]
MVRAKINLPGVITVSIFLFSVLFVPVFAQEIVIFHINDSHGHFAPIIKDKKSIYGLARMAAELKSLRKKKPGRVLFIHAGDSFSRADPVGIYSKGAFNIQIYNRLGLDVFLPGNGEFYFTLNNLKSRLKAAQFSVLGANILERKNKQRFLLPYIVKQSSGRKIGILGLTFVHTHVPSGYEIILQEPIAVARKFIRKIRADVDYLILLSHLGLKQDKKLVSDTGGIDLVIGGHSHDSLEKPLWLRNNRNRKIPVVQAGKYFQSYGRIALNFSGEKMVGFQYRLVKLDENIPVDQETEDFLLQEQKVVSRVLGQSRWNFDRKKTIRFVLKMIKDYSKAAVCIIDRTAIRADIKKGRFNIAAICRLHPWRNRIFVSMLSASDLKKALQQKNLHFLGFSELLSRVIPDGRKKAEDKILVAYPEYVHAYLPFLKNRPYRILEKDLHELLLKYLPVYLH